jgi:glutathione synthase/RimK-type ligase-like ATP-grasp enzyme
MPAIAFATTHKVLDLTSDDHSAVNVLAQHGVVVRPAVWNDARVDWQMFDAVVVRSCWDYHLQPQAFRQWIDDLTRMNVPLWNQPQTLRWNMDKTYLRDLAQRGIVVPPTVWIERGSSVNLITLLQEQRWERAVIKPTISATAHHTFITTPEHATTNNAHAAYVLQQSGLIVQEFVPEVVAGGEWSLMFFAKRYSHAVLKHPNDGDFRVQSDFGGTAEAAQPAPYLIEQAQRIVNSVAEPLLYARVDGVDRDGTFVLMELELIEPFLFLSTAPHAAAHFASAMLEHLI